MTIGAGDVCKVAHELTDRLKNLFLRQKAAVGKNPRGGELSGGLCNNRGS
jgi:hypothetical protein